MRVNKEQIRSLNQEIIDDHREVIGLYLKYWEEHILPIKEKQRQKAFIEILLSVAERLYGIEIFSEISLQMFKSGK